MNNSNQPKSVVRGTYVLGAWSIAWAIVNNKEVLSVTVFWWCGWLREDQILSLPFGVFQLNSELNLYETEGTKNNQVYCVCREAYY